MSSSTSPDGPSPDNYSRRKLLREGTWVVLGRVLTVLAAFVGLRLLTEYLPPDVYAQVGLLLGFAGLANLLVCMPLNQAAHRFFPELQISGNLYAMRRMLGRLLRYGVLLIAVVFTLGGIAYAHLFGGSYVVMALVALMLGGEVAQTFELNLLGAARRQQLVAIWLTAVAWARPAMAILAIILLGPSASAVFLGYFVASGGLVVAMHLLPISLEGTAPPASGTEGEPPSALLPPELRKQIVTYALPLLPLGIVGWVHSLGDRYIIERLIGLKEAGLYIAAYNLVLRPFQMAEKMLHQTLLPPYNQAVSARDHYQMKRLFRLWLGVCVAVVVFGCVCVALLNHWVASLLLAKEYRSSASLMPLLGVGFACLTVAHVFESRLYSLKRTGFVLLGQTIGAATSLALAIPMIMTWGLWGAAAACPAYYAVYLLTMMTLSQIAIVQFHRAAPPPDEATPAPDDAASETQ